MKPKGVSQYGLAIYIKKYLKAKKNYGNSNISPCQNTIFHYGLAIYIKNYLKAKKNYGNSNISPCQNTIFKKSL
jgi:hypothetical protein